YKLFFIRNITKQSFELSVCQDFYKTKQELSIKTEANCDRFNTMTWYYENNRANIYLPVLSSNLKASEKSKLDKKSDSLKTGKFDYSMVEYLNNNSLQKFNTATINQYLTESNISYGVSRANVPLNLKTVEINAPNPFQRNYLVVNLTAVKPEVKYPDCSRIFYSVDEVTKEQSPLIVCKLDLSKSNLSAMPKQVYNYTNMQQLILGTTNISQDEIDQLQKALPNCKIDYSIYQEPKQNKETVLGTVLFDGKGYITSESQQLIQQIAQQLKSDQSRKIKIEASYRTNADRKKLDGYITSVEDIFSKLGIAVKSSQLETTITQQQLQQQQQSNAASIGNISISLIGINFPEADNNKKSAN
ncbi:MAG: hypothetical protein ABI861_08635, partial [Panacibacter sp.]